MTDDQIIQKAEDQAEVIVKRRPFTSYEEEEVHLQINRDAFQRLIELAKIGAASEHGPKS